MGGNVKRDVKKYLILIELSLFDKKLFTITDFERFMGYERQQKHVRDISNQLIEIGILKFSHRDYTRKYYTCDKKKLTDFIDELKLTLRYWDYFKRWHHVLGW